MYTKRMSEEHKQVFFFILAWREMHTKRMSGEQFFFFDARISEEREGMNEVFYLL